METETLPAVPTFNRGGAVAVSEEESEGFSSKDAKPAWLSVVQPTSEILGEHPEWRGQFLYDKAHPLGNVLDFTILQAKRVYVEDLPYAPGNNPMRWFSLAQAKASGKRFKEEAYAVVAISLGEELADKIGTGIRDFAGRKVLVAAWTLRGSFYQIITGRVMDKDGPKMGGKWHRAEFKYAAKQVKSPKGTFMVPDFKGLTKNSEEYVAALEATGLTE